MPRKKKEKIVNWKLMCEYQQKELYKLHQKLDERQDKYNFTATPTCPTPQMYIDKDKEQLNLIEFPSDIAKYLEEFFNKGRQISREKNHDYGNGDVFGNFREFGTQGFLVRMSDKWARIKTFAASGKLFVKDESVLDTLIDLANYCALLGAWLHNEKLQRDGLTYQDVVKGTRVE